MQQQALVTGGRGFIGRHLCHALEQKGWAVTSVDIRPIQESSTTSTIEQRMLDARDPECLATLVEGRDVVFHLAADMGGMGFIGQKENDHAIVDANLSLTRAVANAAARSNARVVYTSSACVYPDKIQENTECRPLQEDDAGLPPSDAYGWEKLAGEQLLMFSLGPQLERLRIARLHNVFGPKCAWQSGREKAPAALLRKALAIALAAERPTNDSPTLLEVWGDGEQTRTYLFVDDCVDALIRLAEAENDEKLSRPLIVNIGSDQAISVNDLAKMALRIACCPDATIVHADGPQGVRGRNCDFSRIQNRLGWAPSTPLEDGLRQTATWIRYEMEASLTGLSPAQQAAQLLEWSKSFTSTAGSPSPTSFAVLLAITSRSHNQCEAFWDSIGSMTAHLAASVRHDPLWPSMHVVLGLDDDDPLLGLNCVGRSRLLTHMRERVCWQGGAGAAAASPLHVLSLSAYKPGATCDYWEAMTNAAYAAGCTHFVLLGDDVHIKTAGWMTAVDAAFSDIAARRGLPPGFGCVAFTDTSFPGFPTFPIVTSVHLEIMGGRLLPPDAFVNQDADPFLFQLYRRWDASVMLPGARLENTIGGAGDARYAKCPATWTGDVLDNAVGSAAKWLERHPVGRFAAAGKRERRLVVDIAVPTYRCNLELLRPMLQLSAPEGVSLCYIVIVDRPRQEVSAFLEELEADFGHDWRYRIRCQGVNTGASSARNRALAESAADYVIFLDDDVVPSTDIVKHYVDAFRRHPEARGFAGPTFFPPITTARALGARLAGVTYFWDLPWFGGFPQTLGSKSVKVVPWAVTANVAFRRVHGTSFDLAFPMTGGGEDIDYCLKVTQYKHLVTVPDAKATHPWWSNGRPELSRFWGWAYGDGMLIRMYPQLTYFNLPNAAEALLLAPLGCVAIATAQRLMGPRLPPWLSPGLSIQDASTVLCGLAVGELLAESLAHFVFEPQRHREDGSWPLRVAAVPHALAVRLASEAGRVWGHARTMRLDLLLRRFDWFVGLHPDVFVEERCRAAVRIGCWAASMLAVRQVCALVR